MAAEVLAKTQGMPRERWLEIRRQGIGGSDAAAIAGINPWKSPMAVYLEKIGELKDDEEQSEAAYWGQTMEEIVAQEFAKRTGLKVRRRNAILRSTEHPFMIANVDRIVAGEQVPLECKTTSAYNARDWEDGRVPDHYMIQVQHYLAVIGAPYGYIAVLIGGQRFLWQKVDRDEELIHYLIRIERQFWEEHVVPRVPPPVDGSWASTELLDKLYPADAAKPEQMALPPTALDLIEEYERAKADEKAAKARVDEAANKLKALMGEYEVGLVGDRAVHWKVITQNRVDPKLLKQKYPAIYAEVVKESKSRRFEVK